MWSKYSQVIGIKDYFLLNSFTAFLLFLLFFWWASYKTFELRHRSDSVLRHLPPGTDIICFPISPPPRAVLRISTFSVSFASPASAGPQEMATHSSILAWRLPWTEEPGGLQWLSSSLCNLRHTSRIRAYFLFWKMRKVLKMFQETLDIILLP